MDILIEYEHIIRPGIFVGLLFLLAGIEFLIPLAERSISRPRQWLTNISIVIIDTITLKLIFPLLAVGVAKYADKNSVGLFNLVEVNYMISIILSLFMLDLLIYGQHLIMHKIPQFWRLHRMHHTEIGLDVTSAVRFHPFEIIISMLIKMAFVLIMGIPVAAVILFEVVLNGLALFNHSNIKIPAPLESILRKIIVTPEIHWIHHSEFKNETNSNFGFNLCIWDKIFGTYIDKPKVGFKEMNQGLPEFGLDKPLGLNELIVSPFKEYPSTDNKNKAK